MARTAKTLLLGLLTASLLLLCSSGMAGRVVRVVEPLAEPMRQTICLAPFDIQTALGPDNDFIFRGTVQSIQEVEITWRNADGQRADPHFLSVCTIVVSDVFCGSTKGPGDTVVLVADQSSRGLPEDAYTLEEGAEYTLITHTYDETDRAQSQQDGDRPLREYTLGDVRLLSSVSGLMAIRGDTVFYRSGWPIDGAAVPAAEGADVAYSSCDASSFDRQFRALIAQYKGR